MNKSLEGLKEKTKEIFDLERKLDKLYEQKREIINFLRLNKKPQQQLPLSGFFISHIEYMQEDCRGVIMTQEDLNELQSKYPSPEAAIQHSERKREASERQCACCDSPSYWDSECFFNDHKIGRRITSNDITDKLHNQKPPLQWLFNSYLCKEDMT